MSSPRISIVIPCFNPGSLLALCLDGLIAQRYAEKEIVIVDGGSTDGSLEIIRAYAGRHPFISWVSEKDKGIYDAMNKGVGLATGEWIYFLGADDRLYNDDILSQIFSDNIGERTSIIYGNVEFLYSKKIYDGPFDLYKILFVSNICHQAMFYRRSVFDLVGLYNINCRIYADRDLNIRCFLEKSIGIKYVDRIIAVYNEQDGASAVDKTDTVFRERQEQYIKEYNKRPSRRVALAVQSLRTGLKNILKP